MAMPALARVVNTLRAARRTPDVPDTDPQLLARFTKSGDEAAFRALVRRHGPAVQAACRQVLSDPADQDDAFQAAFVVLFRRAKSASTVSSLGGWLFAVAHRVAVRCRTDKSRRSAREAEAARRTRTVADAPDPAVRELADLLHAELNALPDKYRLPLLLCLVRGLSRDEAAAELGSTFETVRWGLERGRTLLARRLVKRGVVLSATLLAAAVGTSAATGSPSADLIELAVRACGAASPAVSVLAHGAFPMSTFKWSVLPAVLVFGLIGVGVGWNFGPSPATADEKPAMKAEKPGAKPDANPERPTRVGGTITGPDGKPVAGAEVFVGYYRTGGMWSPDRSQATRIATTEKDGTFTADVPKDAPIHFWVYATKPGLGVAWVEPAYPKPTFAEPMKLTLRMVTDQPIRGKVLTVEGKPAVGVTVNVFTLMDPTARDFDKFLKGAANGGFGQVGQWDHPLHPPADLFATTTDKDGAYEMKGVGSDRIVGMVLDGNGIARQSGMVLTRPNVDVTALNKQPGGSTIKGKGRHAIFYPPDATLVVEPGYAVEGVVTDKKTGKPIEGCQLDMNTGFWDRVVARTDKDGKYRFDGLTKGMGHSVHVSPPKAADVFPTWSDVEAGNGFQTVKKDIALSPGAVFAGKVIDKQTKESVGASFQIIPDIDNEFAKKPEYETAGRDMVWKGGSSTFRIVTLPGKSKVNVQVNPTGVLHGQPYHPYLSGQTLTIDLKESGNAEVVVEVERGRTATVKAVDADGKPVGGMVTAGQTNHDYGYGDEWPDVYKLPASDSAFIVYGLAAGKKRTVIVMVPDKRLAGVLKVVGDDTAEVKLLPVQPIRGTFTDPDGTPLAGVTVAIDYDARVESLFREHATKWMMSAVTDKDGTFEIPDVIPGLPFTFDARKGDTSYRGMPRLGTKTVTPGKPLELGTRKLEEARD